MPLMVKGVIAGLAATVVLSAIMVMKQMMGLMPELNAIAMMTKMAGAGTPLVGWVMHFVIGSVAWGLLFTLLHDKLPGGPVLSGILFAIGAWVLMMVMVMPMAGAGLFGLGIGMMAPVMTLILHVIFGAILGAVFDRLTGQAAVQG